MHATYIGPGVTHDIHQCCVPCTAVAVRFAQDKYTFAENVVRGIVVLTASGDTSRPFTVVVHSRDGSATGGCCAAQHCISGV